METPPLTRKPHPMILVAAASVTALSLTGMATLAGWLPLRGTAATSPMAPLAAVLPETTKPATPTTGGKGDAPATLSIPAGSRITVEANGARHQARAATPRPAPAAVAARPAVGAAAEPGLMRTSAPPPNDSGIYVENARPLPPTTQGQSAPQPNAQAPAVCHDCGTIESVREISSRGEGTGLGAVAGGVLGGLLGSQVGGGNGKKAMAVVGAAGGAYAGHEVEKRMRGQTQYEITVRFDDGRVRTYTETQATPLQNGDRVRLANGRLTML